MSRWRDSEYGDDYRGGEHGLGFRNYDESRYTNNSRSRREDDDRRRYGDPLYYTDDRGREYMGPWTEEGDRGYDQSRDMRMRDDRLYDQHRAERYLYGEYGVGSGRDESYYDRYRDRNVDRYREYYEQRNPRFSRGERFGESHQHHYHARTSDNWDRPAAFNTGGYGAAELKRDDEGFGNVSGYESRDMPVQRDSDYRNNSLDRKRW